MPFEKGNVKVGRQWQPGQSGNPAGKPKGTIHLSTAIQRMLNEQTFDPDDIEKKRAKGTKMEAIIATGMIKAAEGDTKWADWLAKYGYGQKFELEHSGEVATGEINSELAARFSEYLKDTTKK